MRRPAWVVMTYAVLLLLAVVMALPNFLSKDMRDRLPPWLGLSPFAKEESMAG
jgi:SecD/SecF fusion protein